MYLHKPLLIRDCCWLKTEIRGHDENQPAISSFCVLVYFLTPVGYLCPLSYFLWNKQYNSNLQDSLKTLNVGWMSRLCKNLDMLKKKKLKCLFII